MIISVQNNKGGNSKSTTATSLASVMAKDGKKVLLVDTDPQGNCAVIFGYAPSEFENTLYDVIMKEDVLAKDVIIEIADNIDLLPSNGDLDFFDMDVMAHLDSFNSPYTLLAEVIEQVKDSYDYIIIDTPSYMGLMILNVIYATDKVLIPFVPDALSYQGVINLINKIEEYRVSLNTEIEIVGILPVLVERRTRVHQDVMNMIKSDVEGMGKLYIDIEIPKSIAYSSSVAYNTRPAVETNKEIRDRYTSIYKHIIEK